MKKILFCMIAGTALATASCSKDETTVMNTGDEIAFRTAMASRAVETTINNLEAFKVTALTEEEASYFSNVTFTKSSGTTSFYSSTAYYWPTGTLSFYAYAPDSLTATINSTSKTLDITPNTEIKDQYDFITDNATGSKANNESSGVALVFEHRLSQIQVKAKNGNEGYVYKVKGVKIGSVESTGTFDFSTEAFTSPLSGTKADYMIKYDTVHTLTSTAVDIMDETDASDPNGCAMLIPQQLTAWDPDNDGDNSAGNAYLSVLVNISTKDGAQIYPPADGAYGWASVGISTNWEPGKRYIYTLDFSNGAGNVDPEGPGGGDPDIDPENPNDPDNPDPDPEDEKDPGDEILGSSIYFTVTVEEWVDAASQDIEL